MAQAVALAQEIDGRERLYRNLLVYRGNENFDLKTKPPHEIPNEQFEPYLPSGVGQDVLRKIITRSQQLFAEHPVNVARLAKGQREATTVWLWGEGHVPSMPTFEERFGVKNGAMITGVDLLRGLANLLGWDCLDVPGITSFHDTDYAGQGRATAKALDQFDIVLSHIESPDEASHQADVKTKIAAIEAIDEHVVGPVLKKLRTFDDWRILVLPDHPTNIATRKHGYAPTLWAVAGSDVHPTGLKNYSEHEAKSGKMFENGHDLMPWFLDRSR